jgi:diguanylate cyclase (GGDEF)-like protein/PAS domain S-box-containing protein
MGASAHAQSEGRSQLTPSEVDRGASELVRRPGTVGSQELLESAFAQAPIGMALAGLDGHWLKVNRAVCQITGFSEAELIGARAPYPFWPLERRLQNEVLWRRMIRRPGATFELVLMRKCGERFEAQITVSPAVDAGGESRGFVHTIRDISLQLRQQRELERLARTDSLTGLSNRRVLQESLERAAALARRHRQPLALILLDIDRFKQVNDRYGHPAGDAVLVEVAQRLAATMRSGELLARVGGEEFACLITDARAEEAITVADRARRVMAAMPFQAAGGLTVSAGVGLMRAPEDGDCLYRLADRALYDAKREGRNRTRCLAAGDDLALGGLGGELPLLTLD